MEDGNAAVTPLSSHQPPPWLGWLLLVSLLVMLNTHLFITMTAGVDQYSFYAADSAAAQPYPQALAQGPYPVLLTFIINVLLAFLAYGIYRLIWRRFTSHRAPGPGSATRNPFKQNAIAFAIPVCVAMGPSFVLSYTVLKPYFIIVGALIAVVLGIVGALKDPDVTLDPATRGYWFHVAAVATFLMMALAVVVTLFFQIIPPEPPDSNIFWELEWDRYPLEEFRQEAREGMLLFGLASIAYMVVVLGGTLLATLHPPRIGPRSQAPHTGTLYGANLTFFEIPTDNPGEWASEILRLLSQEVLGNEEDPSYLAVLSGREQPLSAAQYARLSDERSGLLNDVDILVDRARGTAKHRTGSGLKRIGVHTNRGNATFLTLCLYSRNPGRRFTVSEIRNLLAKETGREAPSNIHYIISTLESKGLPLEREPKEGVTYLRDDQKIRFLDDLET